MKHGDHGGDIYRNQIKQDFSINVNPLGMPEPVVETLRDNISSWSAYPDPDCENLRKSLSEKLRCPMEKIVCGNGAADLIYHLVRVLAPQKALIPAPAFSEYARALKTVPCEIVYYYMKPEKDFALDVSDFVSKITPDIDLVFLCNPNNPNGLLISEEDVYRIAETCRSHQAVLVVDECFMELTGVGRADAWKQDAAWITLRAFTKTYAMAGLRLGYMIVDNAAIRKRLIADMQPWSVSLPAQIAGAAALKAEDYLERSRSLIRQERSYMMEQLAGLGCKVFPSDANFIFFYVDQIDLYEKLLEKGILIRDCSNYEGLKKGYYRICVKTREENDILIRTIKTLL
jgi:threonine-phosphate decarboxylase